MKPTYRLMHSRLLRTSGISLSSSSCSDSLSLLLPRGAFLNRSFYCMACARTCVPFRRGSLLARKEGRKSYPSDGGAIKSDGFSPPADPPPPGGLAESPPARHTKFLDALHASLPPGSHDPFFFLCYTLTMPISFPETIFFLSPFVTCHFPFFCVSFPRDLAARNGLDHAIFTFVPCR